MKNIESTMKIVNKIEAETLDRNTNVSIITELTDNKYLIKYSGNIGDNLRNLLSKDKISKDLAKIKRVLLLKRN
jgi:hypothetical protein